MIDPVTSESNTLTQSVGAYAREATKPLSTVVTANEYAVYAQNLLGINFQFMIFENLFFYETTPESSPRPLETTIQPVNSRPNR